MVGDGALTLTPARVALGGEMMLTLQLQSGSKRAQKLAIDYRVHYVKAHGGTSPKVFKGWQLDLPPGAQVTLKKRHSLRPVTTRRHHAGEHGVAVQINGWVVTEHSFVLTLPKDNEKETANG